MSKWNVLGKTQRKKQIVPTMIVFLKVKEKTKPNNDNVTAAEDDDTRA